MMQQLEEVWRRVKVGTPPVSNEKWEIVERVTLALLLVVIAHYLFVLIWSLGEPILEGHALRQTQTALSSYWMLQGGPLFNYETPVRGAPWTIPMEFPVYQWSVALLAMTGIPLDNAGRITSTLYLFACFWPIGMIVRSLQLGRFAYLALLVLLFAAPIYLFTGRAFLIETCALFFGLLCLAFIIRAGESRKLSHLLISAVAGALGVLAKSTSLPAFSLLAGFYFLYVAYGDLFIRRDVQKLPFLALFALALIAPYIVGLSWVAYSDSIKAQYAVSTGLTSDHLKKFNYGEWSARFGKRLWGEVLPDRAFPHMLGYAGLIGVGFGIAALSSRRHTILVVACLVAFIVPMLIFTNLHVVHRYYQAANAVFLLGAVALSLSVIYQHGKKGAAAAMLGLIVVGQLMFYHDKDFHRIRNLSPIQVHKHAIGHAADALMPPDVALFFYDGGWSSELPYYAKRKSVALGILRGNQLRDAFEKPETVLGDMQLGGIIVCGKVRREAVRFLRDRDLLAEHGPCRLLAPTQNK